MEVRREPCGWSCHWTCWLVHNSPGWRGGGGGGGRAVQSQNTAEDCTACHPQRVHTDRLKSCCCRWQKLHKLRCFQLFLARWSENSPNCSASDLKLSWHPGSRCPAPGATIGWRRREPPPWAAPPSLACLLSYLFLLATGAICNGSERVINIQRLQESHNEDIRSQAAC